MAAEHLDENGLAVIAIHIPDIAALYHPFSKGKQLVLHDDVIAYIDYKAYPIPISYEIRLKFVGSFDEREKTVITQLVREHYGLRVQDKKLDLTYLYIKLLALIVLGVTFLSASFGVQYLPVNHMIKETLSIIGTFALWEATNTYILERRSAKTQFLNAGQLATAEISFCDETKI